MASAGFRYTDLLPVSGAVAEHTPAVALPRIIDDPKDQAVIEAAVSARVKVICTADVHFQSLQVREYLNGSGVAIMTDRELLTVLRGGPMI